MRSARLSVMMCNYNHGKYLSQAIESMVSQSRPPDEYIILDDGSTDESVSVMESYRERYSYIRLLRHEKNLGFFRSWHDVFEAATCEYIYSTAADDYVLPGFLEHAMAMAEQYPKAGIIFGKMVSVDESGRSLRVDGVERWQESLFAPPERYLREFVDGEHPMQSLAAATIYKRSALAEVGYLRPELDSWWDTFAARAIGLKYGACYVPKPFVAWRVVRGSMSDRSQENPQRMLDIAVRAAALMRSEAFRDRFPEPGVRRWEEGFRQCVLGNYRHRLEASYQDLMACYQKGLSLGNRYERVFLRGCLKAMSFFRRVCEGRIRHHLAQYRGGFSGRANTG
jgi:hypothetical protein